MRKADLLRRLRVLYRGRRPLNLTEAKSRSPELVEAAYALKPFLGWKRALEQVGIVYSQIVVEMTEFVECALCGKEVRNLPGHLRMLHEWGVEDYQAEYPEAEI